MKKIIALLLALAMVMSLAACGGSSEPAATEAPKADAPAAEAPAAEAVTIKVAGIETAYGSQVWADVAAAFDNSIFSICSGATFSPLARIIRFFLRPVICTKFSSSA